MTLGEPASCRAGPRLPVGRALGHGGSRRHQLGRGGGIQPVAAADQRPGAEGGVELVARECHVVDPERVQVDLPVRRQLGGVQGHPAPHAPGHRGQLGDRPELTGDVGGPGQDHEAVAAARGSQRRLEQDHGVRGAAGNGQAHRALGVPRQEGGVVLALEHVDRRVVAATGPAG